MRYDEMDREARERFAEAYASGATREELATAFAISKVTVTAWTKKPEMQALIALYRRQRANRVLRITDNAILARLENSQARDEMDLKELLAIRREFAPNEVTVGRPGEIDARTELAAWAALDAGEDLPELEAGIEEAEEVE